MYIINKFDDGGELKQYGIKHNASSNVIRQEYLGKSFPAVKECELTKTCALCVSINWHFQFLSSFLNANTKSESFTEV